MKTPLIIPALCLVMATAFTGCETPGEGAAVGALAGAAIGAVAGQNIQSAAIGAGAGAAAGALVGKVKQDERRRQYPGYYEDRAYGRGEYRELPVARKTDRRGYVISPYKPYAVIDVRGIPRGSRVLDPVSKREFVNP